jgi:hypothetical protein
MTLVLGLSIAVLVAGLGTYITLQHRLRFILTRRNAGWILLRLVIPMAAAAGWYGLVNVAGRRGIIEAITRGIVAGGLGGSGAHLTAIIQKPSARTIQPQGGKRRRAAKTALAALNWFPSSIEKEIRAKSDFAHRDLVRYHYFPRLSRHLNYLEFAQTYREDLEYANPQRTFTQRRRRLAWIDREVANTTTYWAALHDPERYRVLYSVLITTLLREYNEVAFVEQLMYESSRLFHPFRNRLPTAKPVPPFPPQWPPRADVAFGNDGFPPQPPYR